MTCALTKWALKFKFSVIRVLLVLVTTTTAICLNQPEEVNDCLTVFIKAAAIFHYVLKYTNLNHEVLKY